MTNDLGCGTLVSAGTSWYYKNVKACRKVWWFMGNKFINLFDHSLIMIITVILLVIGILFQVIIGVVYQRMIQSADTLSGVESKLLTQCKERFVNSYKMNGGVPNISVFVDKFINRIKFCGMSVNFMKHLSGQLMLAGVFVAGFGVCKGIVEGIKFINLLPFYIVSLFGIYLYLSIVSMVDLQSRRQMLKTNLTDYLENTVAQRLEYGIMEKEKLLWEMAQSNFSSNADKHDNSIKQSAKKYNAVKESNKIADKIDEDYNISHEDNGFSEEEAKELEQLLHSIIGMNGR